MERSSFLSINFCAKGEYLDSLLRQKTGRHQVPHDRSFNRKIWGGAAMSRLSASYSMCTTTIPDRAMAAMMAAALKKKSRPARPPL